MSDSEYKKVSKLKYINQIQWNPAEILLLIGFMISFVLELLMVQSSPNLELFYYILNIVWLIFIGILIFLISLSLYYYVKEGQKINAIAFLILSFLLLNLSLIMNLIKDLRAIEYTLMESITFLFNGISGVALFTIIIFSLIYKRTKGSMVATTKVYHILNHNVNAITMWNIIIFIGGILMIIGGTLMADIIIYGCAMGTFFGITFLIEILISLIALGISIPLLAYGIKNLE